MSKRSVEDQVFNLFDSCSVEEAVSRLSLAKTIVRRRERVYEAASPVKKVAGKGGKRKAKVNGRDGRPIAFGAPEVMKVQLPEVSQ